jgi:hypothetical protein
MTGKNAGADKTTADRELLRELKEHAAELLGPSPTPMERSLAETAALCHLHLRCVEVSVVTDGNWNSTQAAYDLKRLDHAHRRYLRAIRTLGIIRRLAVPPLKVVNIAQNQQVATVAGKTS